MAASMLSARALQKRGIEHPSKASNTLARSAPTTHASPSRISSSFLVNGSAIPEVSFDVGESYAGLMPISAAADETKQLYFWYFPSINTSSTDVTFWLNGGPGCSSLEGFLQENGPVLWQYGTYAPVANPYSWTNLTNMVWVEQPVGTGFSQGTPTATGEFDVSQEFLGFLQQFFSTFDNLRNMNMYITGESYAGKYIPYIADAIYNYTESTETSLSTAKPDSIAKLKGTMIYDGVYSDTVYRSEISVNRFVTANPQFFNLNETYLAQLANESVACGYEAYLDKYLVYPAVPISAFNGTAWSNCDLWNEVLTATVLVNPCFNIYHITDTCPNPYDVLGFPYSAQYTPPGATVYFNRTDVQQATNAPVQPWSECSDVNVFVNADDTSPDVYMDVLPRVIEKNQRTILGHGKRDYITMSEGTRLAIQNMTWHGKQGFDQMPSTPYIVEAEGTTGIYHEERGLTYVEIAASGHMIPQYAPGSAFKMLQYMLGQIDTFDVATTTSASGTHVPDSINSTRFFRRHLSSLWRRLRGRMY